MIKTTESKNQENTIDIHRKKTFGRGKNKLLLINGKYTERRKKDDSINTFKILERRGTATKDKVTSYVGKNV